MSIVKLFNSQFNEFLEDVSVVFPDNKDIKTAKFMNSNISRITPTVPIKLWYNNIVVNYYDGINTDDIFNLLFTVDFKPAINSYDGMYSILEIIDLIKTLALELSDSEKNKITKYVINLCKISMMYHSKN
jgi:hypothetical protein